MLLSIDNKPKAYKSDEISLAGCDELLIEGFQINNDSVGFSHETGESTLPFFTGTKRGSRLERLKSYGVFKCDLPPKEFADLLESTNVPF